MKLLKLNNINKPLKISLIILFSPAVYIILLSLNKPGRLCLEAGWLDISYRQCSLTEYLLTNIVYIYFYLWWLILILTLLPFVFYFIKILKTSNSLNPPFSKYCPLTKI